MEIRKVRQHTTLTNRMETYIWLPRSLQGFVLKRDEGSDEVD